MTDLPGLGGVDQGADHRRLLAGAVERLLDRDDVRIGGGLLEELDHHLEALIGVVDDDVLGLDGREAVAAMLADPLREARREGRELQVGPILLVERVEIGDAEEAGRFGDDRLGRTDPLAHHGDELVRHLGRQLEADDAARGGGA